LSDVLLIQPPIRDFYLTKKRTIPYGLMSLATSLQQSGFSVDSLDALATKKSKKIPLPGEMDYLNDYYIRPDQSPLALFYDYRHYGFSLEYLGTQIARSQAFLVGISSLFTPYADEALEIASLVKDQLPNAKVVMGGHHPTTLPLEVLRHEAVDYVIRGEGEQSLPMLAAAVRDNLSVSDIPGLCYLDQNSHPVIKEATLIDDLDALPIPSLEFMNYDFYRRKKQGSMVIMTSRGCPMRCSYCSVNRHSYLNYRRRSVDSVIKEMEIAVEKGVRFIDFEDENLSLNRAWFLNLLDRIIVEFSGLGLELRAMNGLLPTTLDKSTVLVMRNAGFKELNLSLCTTSGAMLNRFSRPNVTTAFENVLIWAEDSGLSTVGYVIIGAPWQNPFESLNDLIYLTNKPVLIGLSVYYPSPGSRDYEFCRQQDLLPGSNNLCRSTALPISHTTSRLEIVTLLRLGRIVNYMKSLANKKKTAVTPNKLRGDRSWICFYRTEISEESIVQGSCTCSRSHFN
jgi:anaerobic magnesium-protoporphyrin IX monomethyl ester cyclase